MFVNSIKGEVCTFISIEPEYTEAFLQKHFFRRNIITEII
jgi:hypothetical protein